MKTSTKLAMAFGVLGVVLTALIMVLTPSDMKELEAMGPDQARAIVMRATYLRGASLFCLAIAIAFVFASLFRRK
jgi:hypothetical protein